MDGEHNILDDVFKAPEEAIETFMDLLAENDVLVNKGATSMESIVRSAAEDRPDQIAYPQLVEQTSGRIRIQHGPHHEDYVWHVAPFVASGKILNFKVTSERAAYALCKIMQKYLPEQVQAKVWLPYADWDIQEITFKAIGLNIDWSFRKETVDKINVELFQTLNSLV